MDIDILTNFLDLIIIRSDSGITYKIQPNSTETDTVINNIYIPTKPSMIYKACTNTKRCQFTKNTGKQN